MLQGSLIILAFVIIAALMMTKKIPTLLALPLMAVVICIIAGVPAVGQDAEGTEIGWLSAVVESGTVRMGSAIMAVIFGAWLGQLMNKTGVTDQQLEKTGRTCGICRVIETQPRCWTAALPSLRAIVRAMMQDNPMRVLASEYDASLSNLTFYPSAAFCQICGIRGDCMENLYLRSGNFEA